MMNGNPKLIESMTVMLYTGEVQSCGIVAHCPSVSGRPELFILEATSGDVRHLLMAVYPDGRRTKASQMIVCDSHGWASVINIYDHFDSVSEIDTAMYNSLIGFLSEPEIVE